MQKFYKIIDFGVEMHRHRGLVSHFARAVVDHRDAEHILRFIIGDRFDHACRVSDGTKELLALVDGYRESTQSWRELGVASCSCFAEMKRCVG